MRSHALVGALGLALCSTQAFAASVRASSELTAEDGTKHKASMAFDGKLTTGWAEDEMGPGEGTWIELKLDRPTQVSSVSIWPGDLRKGKRSLREHARPHTVTITLDVGEEEPVTVQARVRDGATQGPARIDVPIEGLARSVRITVDQAYSGYIRNDLFLSEVAVNFASGERHGGLDKLDTWLASDAGVKAAEAQRTEAIARFDAVDQSEFGDREALDDLMGWVVDGAPYLRERAEREVPYGFRMQAVPPDDTSVQALLKLKDPVAAPSLLLAALRLTGSESRKLERSVSYLEAYALVKGGGRRSVPLWGDPGFEKGALQSFGEPLNLGIGQYGDVYVADVANNRVQVFDTQGVVRSVWGEGAPVITDEFFGKNRAHYVAGAKPSSADVGFTQPVDLVVREDKDDDSVFVLDAAGMVRVFEGSGNFVRSWKVDFDAPLTPGMGGEGHLVLTKGKVVVVWGDEGFVYNEEGDELGRFEIEEGAPHDVLPMKNGKLLLAFRASAASYTLDGFRHATYLEDSLPMGYEAWTMAYDEKGKLWVVTDNGWAIKYKRPGVVDYQVRFSDASVNAPSIAVREDFLFVSAGDKLTLIDALEKRDEAEEAAAE